MNRFQEPYNEKLFKKIKRLKSLQKPEMYLEPMRASMMELFCEYLMALYFRLLYFRNISSIIDLRLGYI